MTRQVNLKKDCSKYCIIRSVRCAAASHAQFIHLIVLRPQKV